MRVVNIQSDRSHGQASSQASNQLNGPTIPNSNRIESQSRLRMRNFLAIACTNAFPFFAYPFLKRAHTDFNLMFVPLLRILSEIMSTTYGLIEKKKTGAALGEHYSSLDICVPTKFFFSKKKVFYLRQ